MLPLLKHSVHLRNSELPYEITCKLKKGVSSEEATIFSESIVGGWISQAISIVVICTIRLSWHSCLKRRHTKNIYNMI